MIKTEDRDALSIDDQSLILKELCTSNGISLNQLESTAECIKSLEMFFSGFPYIIGIKHFPNLTKLVIVGQNITKLENLAFSSELNELWICECKLKKIDNLNFNKKLERCHLYDNKIKKIENLDHLINLNILDLSNNCIKEIEGLSSLTSLQNLNLAGNRIKEIGNSLDSLVKLEDLNLSGNLLSSLKDLISLSRLPSLINLSLKDPLYPDNPTCHLCNYSTYILYHMVNLQRLDNLDVSNTQLRHLAESIVTKKKMYYNMRAKTISRNLTTLKKCLLNEVKTVLELPLSKLKIINFKIKSLQQQHDQENCNFSNKFSSNESNRKQSARTLISNRSINFNTKSQFEAKTTALKRRANAWKDRIKDVNQHHQATVDLLQSLADSSLERLIIELETGGNVRFEQGTPNDLWFTTCSELILSRFCISDFKSYGINGLKLQGITQISNRMLRTRFESLVNEKVSDQSGVPNQKTYSKMVDYLFYVWRDQDQSFHQIIEKGFEENIKGTHLTNSLFISERSRIERLLSKDLCQHDLNQVRQGQILVVKVYVGKSYLYKSNFSSSASHLETADSVQCLKKDFSVSYRQPPESSCGCNSRQSEWFILDHRLVLPEYIVNFEYLFQKPLSLLQLQIGEWLNFRVVSTHTSSLLASAIKSVANRMSVSASVASRVQQMYLEEKEEDEKVFAMNPVIIQRPRIVSLSEEDLIKIAPLDQITNLNLHGNGLLRLRGLSALSQLRHLVVSFNELSRLDDVAHMSHLESIDASYNRINSLEGMRDVSQLKTLNLGWNQLSNLKEDLTILRKHAPLLINLNISNNSWMKPDSVWTRVMVMLKSLQWFNDTLVSEDDRDKATKLMSGTKISSSILAINARKDKQEPRSLHLHSIAKTITLLSSLKPSVKDSSWMSTVTVVNLDDQLLSKLSGVGNLRNLRWASFNSNCISKLEGIENCVKLEELQIQDNCIIKLNALANLTRLVKLDVSGNQITSVDNHIFEKLRSLQHISIENNKISSLKFLAPVTSLIELYIGNNRLNNLREIFHLKPLTSLMILDLFGNSLVQSDNYRLFIIFHLQGLKALDGSVTGGLEEVSAKEMFGGRLTNDFLVEKLEHSNFHEIQQINLPHSFIRSVSLSASHFYNLKSVNLEHNNLTSFSGLIHLHQLQVLCLNYNQIECISHKSKSSKPQIRSQYAMITAPELKQDLSPLLTSLEVLHLGYNKITHLPSLQLSRLTNLKALFLQGNEISKLDGFQRLYHLRELVLDRNKIKNISETSFVSLQSLQELHMEENRISDLSNLHPLDNLQRLYLGMNRVQDLYEIEKLNRLSNLIEISLIGNSVSRRLLHRPLLISQHPEIKIIDGIEVTSEEKTKSEMSYFEQQNVSQESLLPGISSLSRAGSLKVSSAPFAAVFPATQLVEDQRGSRRFREKKQTRLPSKQNSSKSCISKTSFYSTGRSHYNL